MRLRPCGDHAVLLDCASLNEASGWFAARPSGTEHVAKVYAESFRGEEHLGQLLEEAQALVAAVTR